MRKQQIILNSVYHVLSPNIYVDKTRRKNQIKAGEFEGIRIIPLTFGKYTEVKAGCGKTIVVDVSESSPMHIERFVCATEVKSKDEISWEPNVFAASEILIDDATWRIKNAGVVATQLEFDAKKQAYELKRQELKDKVKAIVDGKFAWVSEMYFWEESERRKAIQGLTTDGIKELFKASKKTQKDFLNLLDEYASLKAPTC